MGNRVSTPAVTSQRPELSPPPRPQSVATKPRDCGSEGCGFKPGRPGPSGVWLYPGVETEA